jgi:hypothetical protein
MTRRRPPTVAEALDTLARAWGVGWRVDDRPVPAHVEHRQALGGGVDTYRIYAVDGDRNVLLAQVPRDAYEDGA